MLIQHRKEGDYEQFFIEDNGEQLAELDFTLHPDRMVIRHTEVDPSLQGKNIGFRLVQHAVEYARQKRVRILPLCVFAKKVIQQHPEFHDVLE